MGKSKITSSIEKVTPELAVEWLTANTHNRLKRDRSIAKYARDMLAGNWQLNGESIKFSETGVLLDGQNRLEAVLLSEVTIETVVVRGLPDETQATMDHGSSRRMADDLHLRGEKNAGTLAAVARRVSLWNAGMAVSSKFSPTDAEMFKAIDEDPQVRLCTDYGVSHRGDMADVLPASQMGFGLWLISKGGQVHAKEFFNRLSDGVELEEGAPVLALRRRLRKERNLVGGFVNPSLNLALMVWAWNAHCRKRTLASMQVNPDALTNENFPMPVYFDHPYKHITRPSAKTA